MRGLFGWWNEGDCGGAAAYRHTWWGPALTAVAVGALYGFIPGFRAWYAAVPMAAGLARAFVERRRAILFSGSAVTVRPPFGHPGSVRLADITSVEPCTVGVSFLFRARLVHGLRLYLREGGPVAIPLDFPRAGEIRSRLAAAARPGAGCPSAGRSRPPDSLSAL